MYTSIMFYALKAKLALQKLLTDERGEVNVVAIVVLIAVAIILAVLLKGQLEGLIKTLVGGITKKAQNELGIPET